LRDGAIKNHQLQASFEPLERSAPEQEAPIKSPSISLRARVLGLNSMQCLHRFNLQAESTPAARQAISSQAALLIALDFAHTSSAWHILLDHGAAEGGAQSAGALIAPMPGKIIAIHAAPGDQVAAGQPLIVMEAMKMEHGLVAPFDGALVELAFSLGDQVSEGAMLALIQKPETSH
jgi:biotin carboxyl carrier protein